MSVPEKILREYVRELRKIYLFTDNEAKNYMTLQAFVRGVTLNELEYAVNDILMEAENE